MIPECVREMINRGKEKEVNMKKRGFRSFLLGCVMAAAMVPAAGLPVFAAGGVAVNEENFPDADFRKYVSEQLDPTPDGYLTEEDIQAIDKIKFASEDTKTMKGLEYFTSLTSLYLGEPIYEEMHDLESLDLSGNKELKLMDLCCLGIKELNLNQNMALKSVYITYCGNLNTLDLTGHTDLTLLKCCGCYQIKDVILNGCENLKSLYVYWSFWGPYGPRDDFKELNIGACPLVIDAYTNGVRSETNEGWIPNDSEKINFPDFYKYSSEKGLLCVEKNLNISIDKPEPIEPEPIEPVITGWQQNESGKWLYYGEDGIPVSGWQKIDNKWFYFDLLSIMQTGWQQIGGKWYYFKAGGVMAAKEYCKGYYLNVDGTWTYKAKASWKKDSVGWYYIDNKGWYAKKQSLKIDGKIYKFNAAGYCINP